MYKKAYIPPELEVVEIENQTLMVVLSASDDADDEIEITDDEASEEFEVLTNKRRGEWGNLWKDT